MDDIDKIIIPILESIGCEFPADIKSISLFKDEHIYHATAVALCSINTDVKFNKTLPSSKASRFRVSSLLASEIKALGYTATPVGYEFFLYPNEKDMRSLLRWLVDKVPKPDEGGEQEEILGVGQVLNHQIGESLRVWSEECYDPVGYVKKDNPVHSFHAVPVVIPSNNESISNEVQEYYITKQPLLHQQPVNPFSLYASVFELNAKECVIAQEQERDWEQSNQDDGIKLAASKAMLSTLIADAFRSETNMANVKDIFGSNATSSNDTATGTAFSRRAEFTQASNDGRAQVIGERGIVEDLHKEKTEEELKKEQDEEEQALVAEREKEIARLQDAVVDATEKAKKMDIISSQNESAALQLQGDIASMDETIKKLTESYKVVKRTSDLMNVGDADKNMDQLRQIIKESTERIIKLTTEWESFRQPILAKYRRSKQLLRERKDEVGVKVEHIKRMRVEMKLKAEDIRSKTKLHEQLVEDLNKLPKTINRQVYVKGIMDMVKNLKKQDKLIDDVLESVKQVQKDINLALKAKTRCFGVADEVIYHAALNEAQKGVPPNEQFGTPAYKNIVALRDSYAKLIHRVEETGHCKNEIRDITAQIDVVSSKNTAENMNRVAADLEQVKKENETLKKKVKKYMA